MFASSKEKYYYNSSEFEQIADFLRIGIKNVINLLSVCLLMSLLKFCGSMYLLKGIIWFQQPPTYQLHQLNQQPPSYEEIPSFEQVQAYRQAHSFI